MSFQLLGGGSHGRGEREGKGRTVIDAVNEEKK